MKFYNIIADYYESFFPLEPQKIRFIKANQPVNNNKLLDLGCGTGQLCHELAGEDLKPTGIDLSGKMIEMARAKNPKLDFHKLDILQILNHFSCQQFGQITCLGNTIAHLKNQTEIVELLSRVYTLLDKPGSLIIQIMNFDYIISNQIDELPLIETKEWTFKRNYFLDNNQIRFVTTLTNRNKQEDYENEVILFPIMKNQLETLLEQTGFKSIKEYSDFYENPFSQKSLSYILVVNKDN
ncbi:MAG: class I SAM-dependent methyltransferase [Spirochaetes bacterium]|nr:class I SAM-dependent methyltransferase [Spirochaetota bacterium]